MLSLFWMAKITDLEIIFVLKQNDRFIQFNSHVTYCFVEIVYNRNVVKLFFWNVSIVAKVIQILESWSQTNFLTIFVKCPELADKQWKNQNLPTKIDVQTIVNTTMTSGVLALELPTDHEYRQIMKLIDGFSWSELEMLQWLFVCAWYNLWLM